jgi:hypothetical protein
MPDDSEDTDLVSPFGCLPDLTRDSKRHGGEAAPVPPIQPRDECERLLLGAATDCGVSLPHAAVSSEGLYE